MSESTVAKCFDYIVTYFGGDSNGQVIAGNVELHTEKPLKIDFAADIQQVKTLMIKANRALQGKNFGIMGVIPLHKEL